MQRSPFKSLSIPTGLPRLLAVAPLAVGSVLLTSAAAQALTFNFDYSFDTNNFFSDPARRTALESAADVFEARLTDDLSAINPGPSGFGFNNTWTTNVFNPADPDNGAARIQVQDLFVPADTLIVYAGGANLGGSTLGVGGPGGYTASGTSEFFTNLQTRGEAGADDTNPTDTAPWGGAISFDTLTNWNFDVASGPVAGQSDFQSVAIHELAHLLGLGTADSWETFVNPIAVNTATFTGPASQAVFGGPVPLDGDFNGAIAVSDFGHWIEGTMSTLPGTTTLQEAAMDPTITVGTRKLFTDLDFAALDDVGWDVEPVGATPVPAPSLLLGALGFGAKLLAKRRQLNGQQVA